MKYQLFVIVGLVLLLVSCKSVKTNVSENSLVNIKTIKLSEEDKRKFDYFFFEAIREKMKGNIQKSIMYYNECLKLDPTSAVTMYEMANIYYNVKEFARAQGLLERAVTLNHNNVWYKLLLAELYQMNKLNDNAIRIYKALVEENPDNDEYLYGLAQLYQRNNNHENAIDTYNKLENKTGLNEIISLEKEKIYLDINKNKSALNELEKLVDKYPGESRYYGFIADYYLFLKDYDNALLFYNKVLEINPDNGLAFFSIANLDLIKRDTVNFKSNFKKGLLSKGLLYSVKLQKIVPLIVDHKDGFIMDSDIEYYFTLLINNYPHESNGFIYYGNYLKSIENSKGALSAFKSAIKIEPNNEMVWQEILFLEYDLKLFDDIKIDGVSAIEKFPEIAIFYLLTGSSYMQSEEFEESLKFLEEGIKYCGNNEKLKSQFYASIGDAYHSLDDSKTAFKFYDEALQIDELNLVVLNNYSYYLSIEKRDLKKAETMISRCVELEPGNSTYLDTYAWVMFQMKRYFEAKYLIERAIDNGGELSDVILEHYGDILYMNGDTKDAIIQWNRAIKLGDGSDKLKEKIDKGEYVE